MLLHCALHCANIIFRSAFKRWGRDEMSALQQTHGLELKPGHVAQYSLKKCINNATNSATYEWCTGSVTKASDGSSLVNDGNGRFYSKG